MHIAGGDDETRKNARPDFASRRLKRPLGMDGTSSHKSPGTALILTGGGARAAYQVGVLLAVSKLSSNSHHNPFPILCGTSAGAINAAGIACLADNFGKAVSILAGVWRNMRAHDIYRADALGIGLSGVRWMSALTP